MNEDKPLNKEKRLEIIKWVVIAILSTMAIVGNYYYQNINLFFRSSVVILIFIMVAIVFFITKKGKTVLSFMREARIEARKVIWPTRQETLYTTLVIVVVTAVASLILWGLDSLLVSLISFITNLRF